MRTPQHPTWTLLLSSLLVLGVACSGADKKKDTKLKGGSAEYHYKLSSGYYHNQQAAMALREVTLALKQDPDHVQAHYLAGVIYMGRREYNKAITHYKRAVALEPLFFDAQNALGATYLAMKRWDDAASIFETLTDQALYTSPELAHNNLGWANYKRRRYTQAAQNFSMSVDLRPSFCLGYNNMGLVMEAQNQLSEAARYYNEAIERCPNTYAEPHFNLGKLYADSNRERARAHFQSCVNISARSGLGRRCREYLQGL